MGFSHHRGRQQIKLLFVQLCGSPEHAYALEEKIHHEMEERRDRPNGHRKFKREGLHPKDVPPIDQMLSLDE